MMTRNPFPGMNPFFEQQWRDAHSRLVTYLCDALQERLPPDLVARAEEETAVGIGASQLAVTYRPDVTVREPSTLKEPSVEHVISPAPPAAGIEPIRVVVNEEVERWLEIREASGRLVTVLELLSPTNKLESDDRGRYLRKRHSFIQGGANLVEIDLVRQGASVFPAPVRRICREKGACYGVCVFRTMRPGEQEIYPIRLRERLPAVRVPLRPADADMVVDLQPLIDQCHERGRYHLLNYKLELDPPLTPDDAAWAEQLLRQSHLL